MDLGFVRIQMKLCPSDERPLDNRQHWTDAKRIYCHTLTNMGLRIYAWNWLHPDEFLPATGNMPNASAPSKTRGDDNAVLRRVGERI